MNHRFNLQSYADSVYSVNISNALIMHLQRDLHLKGNQQNVALTIFFVPYVLFEIPSNILLKHFKPHKWSRPTSDCPYISGSSNLLDN